LFFHRTKTKIGSSLSGKRRHFENKLLAGNYHVIGISLGEESLRGVGAVE
jgi:hypothetical protein